MANPVNSESVEGSPLIGPAKLCDVSGDQSSCVDLCETVEDIHVVHVNEAKFADVKPLMLREEQSEWFD